MRYLSKSHGGPWLLDSNALAKLDAIFDEAAERAEADRQAKARAHVDEQRGHVEEEVRRDAERDIKRLQRARQVARVVEDEEVTDDVAERIRAVEESVLPTLAKRLERLREGALQIRFPRIKRELVLSFGPQSTETSSSFSAARVLCSQKDRLPAEFEYVLGDVRLRLEDETLKLDQIGASGTSDLVFSLEDWIEENRAPLPQRGWNALRDLGLHWFGGLITLGVLAPAFVEVSSKGPTRAAARTLLEGGVSKEEVPQALEVLLRLELGVPPPGAPSAQLLPLVWLLGGVAALAALIQASPRSALGVTAKGDKRVARWRSWGNWVTKGVPVFLFLLVIKYYAESFLKR